jgi:pectinesterase
MYGPALAKDVNNGIDVWCKRVRSLIVEKWYKGEEDTGAAKISYHVDHGEGADFFSVGKTLGAGSCGLWSDGKVHQPGVFTSSRTLASGPIRLIVELTYDSLLVEGRRFKEVKRITLDAGSNLNKIEATYASDQPGEDLEVAIGLVKRQDVRLFHMLKENLIGLWGLTNADTVNGSLGLGVVLTESAIGEVTEDQAQYIVRARTKAGKAFVYYAGAGWTRSGDFDNEQEWKEYLRRFSRGLRSPLKVHIE